MQAQYKQELVLMIDGLARQIDEAQHDLADAAYTLRQLQGLLATMEPRVQLLDLKSGGD